MKLSRSFKIISVLADLHIGNRRCSADTLRKQLKKYYFKQMEESPYLDAIFILGDLMHTIVSLNSEYSELFHWFISKIYKLAKKKNASVIIIKGTPSHDNDQLNNIKHYQNNEDGVDFRIFEQISETELFGMKLLILPDVRVKKDTDIEKYLENKKYDMILGHGTIDKMQFFQQESENMPMKSYVYKCKDLCKASRGPVLFGHIHQYHEYFDKFYYCGPFTALERGTTMAGYLLLAIDSKHPSNYYVEHVDNPDTARYYEIELDTDDILENSADQIIQAIDEYIADAQPHDLITLRIFRDNENTSADKVLLIEGKYRLDKRFSIIKKIVSDDEEEKQKKFIERKTKYSYILDSGLKVPTIMYRYYANDMKPKLNPNSPEAKLTEEDFYNIFDMEFN